MRHCKKCAGSIPARITVDGKVRNLQNRTYCLSCSPFGEHNRGRRHQGNRSCNACGKLISPKEKSGNTCMACWQKRKEARIEDRVYGVLGNSCWICDYDKGKLGRRMLDFHHVNPPEKCFYVNKRTMANLAWVRVVAEIKKCILICCRCHRELESGMISEEQVNKLHSKMQKLAAKFSVTQLHP